MAPQKPGRLCTVGSSILLYEDQFKEPREIYWLDCNEAKPQLLKEKSFTTSLLYLWDMIGVRNGADELIIASHLHDIHCYSTTTKSLKWSVTGNLPGMQKDLFPVELAHDGYGHLFVCDGYEGNRCIQMFSVSDGQYLGCLIKQGTKGLRRPNRICCHSASHSLVVAHIAGPYWHLSMINIEY